MNESFKTDPSLATSARAAKESGSYLCASNVTPTAVRFVVSVFLCLLCSCRMSSTQMTCSHFRKNRPKRQKPAGCRSRIISKNRPVPIFGWSTGASLIYLSLCKRNVFVFQWCVICFQNYYTIFFPVTLWIECIQAELKVHSSGPQASERQCASYNILANKKCYRTCSRPFGTESLIKLGSPVS